jgi:PAB1-binding protein PBP1
MSGEKKKIEFKNVLYSYIENIGIGCKKNRTINVIEVGILVHNLDTKLKNEIKYTDDIDTLKDKLKKNKFNKEVGYTIDPNLLSLDDEDNEWNQFLSNKVKFNTGSTYKDNIYTTEYNIEEIPEELKIKAENIEKELLNNKASNTHINEERFGVTLKNENEEFQYSSVYRIE